MVYSKLVNFLSNYPKKDKHTHTVYGGDLKQVLTPFLIKLITP